MFRSIKIEMSWVLSFVLAVTSWPLASQAKKPKTLSEEAQEIYELMVPARRPNETISEMYYRLETRLPQLEKDGLAPLLKGHGDLKTPEMSLEGNVWTLKQGGRELKIEILESAKNTRFKVNGVSLSDRDAKDPKRRYEAIKKILEKEPKSAGSLNPLMHLLHLSLQPAHAFNWMSLLIAAVAGLGGFFLGKHIGSKNASSKNNCSVAGPTCCFANGVYQVYSGSGCCQDIGGFGTGYAPSSCPVGSTGQGTVQGVPGAQQ